MRCTYFNKLLKLSKQTSASSQSKINIKLLEVQSMSHPSWQFFGGQVRWQMPPEEQEKIGEEREREREGKHAAQRSPCSRRRSCGYAHAVTRRCAQRCRLANVSRAVCAPRGRFATLAISGAFSCVPHKQRARRIVAHA